MNNFSFVVDKRDSGKRLDRFLANKLSSKFSRSFLQKLINDGSVLLNGKENKSNAKISTGDKIDLSVPEPKEVEIIPEEILLEVRYEDEDLIVVNKPAGLVVHPGAGNHTGTLVNALLFHCKNLSGVGGRLRPGIVHRLDKDTSGLLVAAKNDRAHQGLSAQFATRQITRKYIAFVAGVVELDNGSIDMPIGRDTRDRQKMAVNFTKSKEAYTHYKVLKRFKDYTMLELALGTGRTHQIRAHMKYLGHPLLGDVKYGRSSKRIARHALHAATLGFTHPGTKEFMEFSAELPDDMSKLC